MKFNKYFFFLFPAFVSILNIGCTSFSTPYEKAECVSGDCISGEGKVRFHSGTEVSGQFVMGYPQGSVSVSKPNGDQYRGFMNVGIFNGAVTFNSAAGQNQLNYQSGVPRNLTHKRGRDEYTGSFNTDELGLVNVLGYSQGTYKTERGATYTGNFGYDGRNYTFDGLATFARNKTSKGKFVSQDGASNTAPLKFSPRGGHYVVIGNKDYYQEYDHQGKKIIQRPGPKTIAYTHKNAGCRLSKNGEGWYIWKMSSCSHGNLAAGQGELYSIDGSKVLKGTFSNGEIVKGEYRNAGMTISGSWKDFRAHGQADERLASGERYKGVFRYGIRHGKGILTTSERKETCEYDEGTRIDQVYVMRIEAEKRRVADEKNRIAAEKQRAAAAAASGGKDTTNWPVECIKKLAAIKACEQIGGFGEMACKMITNSNFSCSIPM